MAWVNPNVDPRPLIATSTEKTESSAGGNICMILLVIAALGMFASMSVAKNAIQEIDAAVAGMAPIIPFGIGAIVGRRRTSVGLVILAGIKALEKWYQRSQTLNMRLKVDSGKMSLDVLNIALDNSHRISRYISVPSSDPSCDEMNITIKRLSAEDMADIVRRLSALPNVREAAMI